MDGKISGTERKFYISKFGKTPGELVDDVYSILSEKYNSGCSLDKPKRKRYANQERDDAVVAVTVEIV